MSLVLGLKSQLESSAVFSMYDLHGGTSCSLGDCDVTELTIYELACYRQSKGRFIYRMYNICILANDQQFIVYACDSLH